MDIQEPPAIMLPYDGPMIEIRLPLQRVKTVCYAFGVRGEANQFLMGCSTFRDGGCLLIIPEIEPRVSKERQQQIRDHELAHCNGWRHP